MNGHVGCATHEFLRRAIFGGSTAVEPQLSACRRNALVCRPDTSSITCAEIGSGERAFLAATDALRRWQHFELGWLQAWPTATPLEVGSAIAVIARVFGISWLNACRIVYVVDEDGPVRRFGFAYGTLPGHAECGEERFLVEWDRTSNQVWYDILAFSRRRHRLAKLGYLAVRRLQKRFARDSVVAMQNAVAAAPTTVST